MKSKINMGKIMNVNNIVFCEDTISDNSELIQMIKRSPDEKGICILPFHLNLFYWGQITFDKISYLESKNIQIYFLRDFLSERERIINALQNEESTKIDGLFSIEEFVKIILLDISNKSVYDLLKSIIEKNKIGISSRNIPQFSNLLDGSSHLIKILEQCGNYGPTFMTLGQYLTGKDKKKGAYIKYGENHTKLAASLEMVWILKENNASTIYLTKLGEALNTYGEDQIISYTGKLALRIPIIREILKGTLNGKVNIEQYMRPYLSSSTTLRRKPNIKTLINVINETSDNSIANLVNNII